MRQDDIQLLREETVPERIHAAVLDWCRGRYWHVRIPLLLYFGYIGVRQFGDAEYHSMFGALNLGIHEGGHLLLHSGGQFLHVFGGTFLQLLAPLASMIMFFRQRDYFAIAVCFGWLSTNFHNIGTYMADAEKMQLPLVTVGEATVVTHDWRFLLTKFGLLRQCELLGGFTRGVGHVCMLICLVAGFWMIWQMYRLPESRRQSYKV